MYAAILSIILLAVVFLNLLERMEKTLFGGLNKGYVTE
jgi:NitT/TauT family transport system permease protein